jgi:hypothetical protein
MRLYALVEAGDPEAIDVYLCEQDAQQALEDCLRDKPEWRGLLRVEEVELSTRTPQRLEAPLETRKPLGAVRAAPPAGRARRARL